MYRGEIQNDSIGGNYNRSLDYSPSFSGLGAIGRHETRNFAVGAPLRGAGIVPVGGDDERPKIEEAAGITNFIKRLSFGNKDMERKIDKSIYGEGDDERPKIEVPDMTNFIRLFSLGHKATADKLEKTIYGNGKPFTKEQLTKIILDKNKVIADLEENAYGGDWGADFEKMIEEHNRNNQAQLFNGEGGGWQEEMFSPEEIAETQKLWQEYLAKNPMVKGEGFWDDVRKGVVKHNERKKITPISEEDWKKQMADFKAPTENWGADEGGAAAKVEPKAPSGVAVAAEALQPVRTAIQNKVGDLIYGAETDPKKQRRGLLGISEEGKEASKKKVIKNIVKPLMDGWNQLFNPDKVKEQNRAKWAAESKKAMAKAGWLWEMPDGTYDVLLGTQLDELKTAKLVRQPRRYRRWVVKNQAKNIGYWVDDADEGAPPYIKIPNPIKGMKPNYTIDELKKNDIPFFVPVTRVNATTDNEEVWRGGFEGDDIWVPQDIGKNVYQALNQYKAKMEEEKERAYYESLSAVEKQEYRENKAIEKDTGMTEAAKAKVEKDIADEEAKEKPDTERLAKMKAAQERVRVKGVENFQKSATQTKKVSERKYKEQMAREAAERQAAEEKEKADAAESWKAMTPAERTIQLDAYRKDLQEQGWSEEAIEDAVSQLGEDQSALMVGRMGGGLAISKLIDESKRRDKADIARMPASDKTPEEMIRAEIRRNIATFGEEKAKWFNDRRYEKLAELDAEYERVLARRIELAKEQGRPVNESAIAAMRRQRTKDAEDFAKSLKGGTKGEKETTRPSGLVEIVVNRHQAPPSSNPNEGKTLAQLQEEGEREYQEEKKRKAEKRKAAAAEVEMKKAKIEAARMASEAAKAAAEAVKKAMEEDDDEGEVIVEEYEYDGVLYLIEGGDVFNDRRVFDSETSEELGVLGDDDMKGIAAVVKRKSGSGKDELVGEGAIELTLLTAGHRLFNPTGNMTMANKQTFTPDYDAYGETVEQGRENAFNLSRSMYNQQQAIDLPDFALIQDNTSLRFYLKDDEDVILVGIRGTDVKSWTDLYTWAVIGANQDFRMTTRFQDDLQKLLVFQKQYPMTQYYYVGVGSSLAGSIADRFLDMGLMDEAITYNPSIEKKYVLNGNIHNHRVYLDTDPLFMLMGQYSPNTEIRKNASAANFYNPIKEKDFLIKSHSIFPVYNPAFEGGGMMGAGKTYTIEEWKAIFDAKLEKKRQQIEAREAKKKQTAKAKRERAKARRDGRDEPPPLETPATFRPSRVMKATPPKAPEPEPESSDSGEDVETTKYRVDGKYYYVDDAREGVAFDARVVMDMEDNELGTLGDFREIAKAVFNKEKPKKPRKPRAPKTVPPPASARVELREELVAEQPREPEGQFAQEAEPLQLVVAEIAKQPQRAYMMMLKSPKLTEADRRLLMSLQRSKMAPMGKVKLLARSGLARKLMEILGLDESAFQGQRARMRIADKMEKRVEGEKVREMPRLPEEWKKLVAEWEKATKDRAAFMKDKKKAHEWYKDKLETFDRTFGVAGTSVQVICDSLETEPFFGLWFCQYPTQPANNVMRWMDKDNYNRGDRHRRLVFQAEMTSGDGKVRACGGRIKNILGAPVLSFNTGERLSRTLAVKSVMPLFKECGIPVPELVDGFKGVNGKASARWMIDWTELMPKKDKYKEKDDDEFQAKVNSQMIPKLKQKAYDLTRMIDDERARLEDELVVWMKSLGHLFYMEETIQVKRAQKEARIERQRKMKEPEKEEESEEETTDRELIEQFAKLKKAYEVEEAKKFSSATAKKMEALSAPAQAIIEDWNLIQDQLRDGYFLDQNENDIYFKIDKDGLRFTKFVRPDTTEVVFRNMRKGDEWEPSKTNMKKEEWDFYRQSSLFKFDPDAYKRPSSMWGLLARAIALMSYFRNPATPSKLWSETNHNHEEKFKEWYEGVMRGQE